MDSGVQGLDTTAKHLGGLGDVRDIAHGEPSIADGRGSAARCDQLRSDWERDADEPEARIGVCVQGGRAAHAQRKRMRDSSLPAITRKHRTP